jgi:AcrR family transcriptional regulator
VPRPPSIAPKPAPRPRRGTPEETRDRLVQAAAEVFNRDGYEGTDSNRIAREAGYSPATFYKHFEDKRALFLLVYKEWVAREWRDISTQVAASGSASERAAQIVRMFLQHHRRWRGFRASLRRLVSYDPEVRSFYRAQRRLQLEMLARMRATLGSEGSRAADALLLYTMERSADAQADGEPAALEVDPDALEGLLIELVRARLEPRR